MYLLGEYLQFTDSQKNSVIAQYSAQAGITESEFNMCVDNHELLDAFFKEAHKVCHRDHYSAYTIVEVLRHNHAVEDKSQREFKISNEMKPVLARISTALFPALNGLFKINQRGKHG